MTITRQPEWTDQTRTEEWLKQVALWEKEVMMTVLRCIFHTRLIVPGGKTPSGRRYVADPRQIIRVQDEDRETLLGMTRNTTGCRGCGRGGAVTEPQHYFEEVCV